jgi:CheY-like chemotaxis protein
LRATFAPALGERFSTPSRLSTRILVVDDNADDREIYSNILYYNNFDVILAEDAVQAVKAARESRPDIILMDVYLGEISGLTAAYHIRQDPAICCIPIVCITGFDLNPALGLAVGCESMLQKPVSVEMLMSVIRGLLRGPKRYAQEPLPDASLHTNGSAPKSGRGRNE